MKPIYARIASRLAEAIASEQYPVGSLLPTELELAENYAVSRSTIRAALSELQSLGIVSRKKSMGTRVERARPLAKSSGFVQALESIEAVQQYGVETQREVQDVADVVTDDPLAQQLGCRPGQRWLRISTVRRIPGDLSRLPICWSDIYIDAAHADAVRERMDRHFQIFGTLVEQISGRPIVEIRQDIRAVGVPDRVAATIKAAAGSPSLEIRRQYLQSAGTLAEVSISVHPADRYSYSMRLARFRSG